MRPPVTTMAKNLALAYTTWLKAGCPRRNRGERKEILNVCVLKESIKCEHFIGDMRVKVGHCEECGCDIHIHAQKLKWATTECPIGKWFALPEGIRKKRGKRLTEKAKATIRRLAKDPRAKKGCGGCGKKKKT